METAGTSDDDRSRRPLVDRLVGLDIRRFVSFRRTSVRQHERSAMIAAAALRVLCAGLLVWVGVIHIHVWATGYRHIPTNGPLFLVDGVAALCLAAALLVLPRPVIGLLGTGFLLATLGALVISINIGLFGFMESLSASFVQLSLVIESVATLALIGWTGLTVARR
jgi:hypothetical protein